MKSIQALLILALAFNMNLCLPFSFFRPRLPQGFDDPTVREETNKTEIENNRTTTIQSQSRFGSEEPKQGTINSTQVDDIKEYGLSRNFRAFFGDDDQQELDNTINNNDGTETQQEGRIFNTTIKNRKSDTNLGNLGFQSTFAETGDLEYEDGDNQINEDFSANGKANRQNTFLNFKKNDTDQDETIKNNNFTTRN